MIADVLIDSAADINIQNNDGNTPLHIALVKGTSKSINLMKLFDQIIMK